MSERRYDTAIGKLLRRTAASAGLTTVLLTGYALAEPAVAPHTSPADLAAAEATTNKSLPPPEPVAPDRLRLDDLLERMLAVNPELGAARERWEAARRRPGQERALDDPQLSLGWSAAGAPWPGAGLGSEMAANMGVSVSQMLPFPGKRDLRGGVAEQEARVEMFLYSATERALAARLKTAYYELQYIYEALTVLARDRELLTRIAETAALRYATGSASQQDIVKAQLELSLLETRVLDLERRQLATAAAINSLLNQPVTAPLGRPVAPPAQLPELPSQETLRESALTAAPALRARRSVIDGRRLGLELARRELYPDFEIMGGYYNQGALKDMWEFRVQMDLPFLRPNRRWLKIEESAALLSEARRDYRAQEQAIGFTLRDSYLAAQNARRLATLYAEKIIPQATLALESSLLNYSAGELDFLSVFANFSAILENEINYCQSRADYLKALARIEELTGAPGQDD